MMFYQLINRFVPLNELFSCERKDLVDIDLTIEQRFVTNQRIFQRLKVLLFFS